MELINQVAEKDVWAEFAAAEVDSPRYGQYFDQFIGRPAAERLRSAPVPSWTDEDHRAAREGVWKLRSGYVAPIMALVPKWYSVELATEDLEEVRLIRYPPFLDLAPSRLLGEFVRALDAGRDVPREDFAANYRRLRSSFDSIKMRGVPILVAESREGPITEVEGLTRMACLLSKHIAGERVPSRVKAVLGESARLREWNFY